jgi:hypothetical protein
LAQRVFEGGSLTPQERKNLLEVGTGLVKGKQSQLNIYRKQYIKKAKELGGSEEDILDPYQGLISPSPESSVNQIPTNKKELVKKQPSSQDKSKNVKKWADLP